MRYKDGVNITAEENCSIFCLWVWTVKRYYNKILKLLIEGAI